MLNVHKIKRICYIKGVIAVSYTHLDVYKRQIWYCIIFSGTVLCFGAVSYTHLDVYKRQHLDTNSY